MIVIAAGWITLLLIGGGLALDRVLTNAVSNNFDQQMEYVLTAMIASAEIGPDGEVRLNRPLGDQRFMEPNSGLYYQISGKSQEDFPSRSLWDDPLKPRYDIPGSKPRFRNSNEFVDEPLRIVERAITLPDRYALVLHGGAIDRWLKRAGQGIAYNTGHQLCLAGVGIDNSRRVADALWAVATA
jgi:hypothetical protein